MADPPSMPPIDTFDIVLADAINIVMAAGYVPLKGRSYRQAQERQHVAQARAEWEIESAEQSRAWARDCLARERRLFDRCTYLYGLAARLGATDAQLSGPTVDPDKEPA